MPAHTCMRVRAVPRLSSQAGYAFAPFVRVEACLTRAPCRYSGSNGTRWSLYRQACRWARYHLVRMLGRHCQIWSLWVHNHSILGVISGKERSFEAHVKMKSVLFHINACLRALTTSPTPLSMQCIIPAVFSRSPLIPEFSNGSMHSGGASIGPWMACQAR